jgi:hypothetical protein
MELSPGRDALTMQFGTPQHLNGVDNRQFRTEDAAGIRLGTRGVNSDRTQIPVPSEVRILAGTIAPLPSFPDALRPEGDPKSAPALAPPQPCELGPFSVAVRRIRAMAEADGLALPGAGSDRGRRGEAVLVGQRQLGVNTANPDPVLSKLVTANLDQEIITC